MRGDVLERIKNFVLFFAIGAIGYALIELLWRQRTHWTMMLAGGICFVLFSVIAKRMKGANIFLKCAVAAISVTAVEFVFGVIFNLFLKMDVWDYSEMPFNLMGQICPTFTLLWFALSLLMLPVAEKINDSLLP
ncbi:MAG: hypothetical protein IKY62_03580 [Clostridia bacterium]|nr:hypothetical protein [Clostridia bacterium]